MISQRTKTALAEAKRRGVQLGDPEISKRNREVADALAESLPAASRSHFEACRLYGGTSHSLKMHGATLAFLL
jgi:DNA invertase Pin-like site-specific DNA recombinase